MNALNGLKFVVTGGAGFIGSHLCRTLLEKGVTVTVFDNLSSGKLENIKDLMNLDLKFVQADIRDTEKIEQTTKNCNYFSFSCSVKCSIFDGKSHRRLFD